MKTAAVKKMDTLVATAHNYANQCVSEKRIDSIIKLIGKAKKLNPDAFPDGYKNEAIASMFGVGDCMQAKVGNKVTADGKLVFMTPAMLADVEAGGAEDNDTPQQEGQTNTSSFNRYDGYDESHLSYN